MNRFNDICRKCGRERMQHNSATKKLCRSFTAQNAVTRRETPGTDKSFLIRRTAPLKPAEKIGGMVL